MIDCGLLSAANKAIAAKPRQFVTPAILCAVAMQESGGVPYFIDTKPGSEWSLNLRSARQTTGFTERQIRDMITIPAKIGTYLPPRILIGQLAKFRLEPSYWQKFWRLEKTDRFYYSCSWGLCQFMGPNITKEPTPQGIDFIKVFMASTDLQLLYAAGMLDEVLQKNQGDVDKAYREYNSGDPNSENPSVKGRALAVADRAIQIQQYITEKEAASHV